MTLYGMIFDFIFNHILADTNDLGDYYLQDFYVNCGYRNTDGTQIFYITAREWLCHTLSIISVLFILVACVMLVVKMVKLVGNLVK